MRIILFLITMIIGCNSIKPEPTEVMSNITYYKDYRTNLCFASGFMKISEINTEYLASYVPCTEEVEKLISNKKIK